jgi:hypothetical protein
MLADLSVRGKYATGISATEIIPALEKVNSSAADGLAGYLADHQDLLLKLSTYWTKRREISELLLDLMREEGRAKEDFESISSRQIRSYGVQLPGYHKSSKVLVDTVEFLTQQTCFGLGADVNTNPQSRGAIISNEHIWVSPRRLDGALPALFNPVALWEIKEYWGVTSGGSKMSDAIYEVQLVGTELRLFEDRFGVHVRHYAILDGKRQWESRKSDLRRAVDLLYAGLIDELVVGSEVLSTWPRILAECCDVAKSASVGQMLIDDLS